MNEATAVLELATAVVGLLVAGIGLATASAVRCRYAYRDCDAVEKPTHPAPVFGDPDRARPATGPTSAWEDDGA